MNRYTQLLPFITGYDDPAQTVSAPWQLDGQSPPADVLIFSWATLLYAFTGNESPVFSVDGKPVKADLASRSVESAELDVHSEVSGRSTAICIDDGSAHLQPADCHALSLSFNPATSMGTLRSTWGVDEAFLVQIGRQLKQFVQKQAALSGCQLNLPATEPPEMSISNAFPSTLHGPQLLHELALGGPKGPGLAIEYLAADGAVHSLSYPSLDSLSTRLAFQITAALAPLQIDPAQNVIIPVLLPQSLDLYFSYLGILKAGAAFCPLNVDTPLDRIQFILQDVAASIVITHSSLAGKLPNDERIAVITTDGLDPADIPDASLPWRPCNPSHLAYVMYTSGSTGRPKGVGLSHLAATQSLLAHEDLIPQFQRYLQFASPTFDVSVFEYFFPLVRNATVIACDRETLLRDISGVIRKMNVDAGELTPTVAGELLRTRTAAPSLRVLLTIGEMLTQHVVDEFGQSETAEGMLYAMYGPTEATIHCTAVPKARAHSRVNLIGLPLKTVSAYVASLDPEDNSPGQDPRILPQGQIGELVVGGTQLAEGYLNRPEENAKAFIESPSHGRLYRTGDKARMLPTGDLECFGRASAGQVKLRGQRIELGEIENILCKVANARSAVAIVTSGHLVAFLLVENTMVSDDELRRGCRQWLPRFMIPGEFILVDKFPQLPSGKADRKALESEYINTRQLEQVNDLQTFRDATEEAIFSCVEKVLRRPACATESLAAAGLDSLSAIPLASHLRDVGVNVGVGKLLEADSVDGIWHLAKAPPASPSSDAKGVDLEVVWSAVATAGSARLHSIGLGSEISGVEPCSHIQQSMIAETVRTANAYCNFVELELASPTQFSDVKRALCELAQHNDILRSGFIEIDVKGFPYGRFVWSELKDHIFQKRDQFDYNVSLGDEHGILYPVRVQYREEKDKLRVLLHMHHAIYDGWSWELILGDLDRLLTGNDPIQRPSYKNVTNFFIESAMSDSASESSAYWQDQLYGMSPAMWPNFHPKTDVPCGRGASTRVLDIPMSKLNEASQRLQVSRPAIFQAAFGYLLSSYFGTDDVVFGTVFSGRTLPVQGIESIIGPCIRVLPMRLNLEKVQNAGDLILAAHNLNRKSLDHGNLPLHDIKRASGVDLNLRLFDSTIVWQETIWTDHHRDTLVKESAAADFLEFALLLELEPKDGKVHVKATYQKSILPLAQVEVLLAQIEHVASAFINEPDLSTNDICQNLPQSVLSVQNQDHEKQVDLPSLTSTIEGVASTDPSRPALEFLRSLDPENAAMSVESVTYHQLNQLGNRLAHYLMDQGVKAGDLVVILMDKSVDLYVSILAVLKIGAGYIPITPQSPTRKVHSILTEARPRICITNLLLQQEHALSSFEFLHTVDIHDNVFQKYPDSNISSANDGSAVAYVIFTSGSTGKPKGVLVSHYNVQSNLAVLSELYPKPCGSKMLQACSHGFDVSVFEILFAWNTGMTLCATTNDILFRDIQEVIRGMNITHLSMTPTVAALVDSQAVPGVQFLVTSGEGLTEKVHQNWGGKGLFQGYGPCETTNICSVCPNFETSHALRNIGPPLKNTSAFLILEHDEFCLAPRGAVGELCFGGDQVAQGYLNMPELTAEKFISHAQYGRLYRSGDFARLLPDGSISFVGRRDNQVKLRGQRIELGEINSVLLSAEIVKDCASFVLGTGSRNQKQLVAFWVPSFALHDGSPQVSPATRDLFVKLRETLPGYMIPSHLIPVDLLPMTENGKADHTKLREVFQQMSLDELRILSPEFDTAGSSEDFSQLEKDVATILSDVTGTELHDIRRNTSFYHVGLDSISAISFSRKLREAGFGQLDVSTILRQSSLSRLSAVITTRYDKQISDGSPSERLENVFGDDFIEQTKEEFKKAGKLVQAIYPCTPLQEAMLSAEASQSHSAYFNHLLLELYVDFDGLRHAWNQMLTRHAILKTSFKATNNAQFAYAQVVLGNASLPLQFLDISESQLNSQVEKQKQHFQELFQVSGVLPYSLTAFRDRTQGKAFLLFSIHHALYDGEAMGQLLQEFQSSFSNQHMPEVVPFERFISHMVSTDVNASDSYWDHYLSGVSPNLLAGFKNDKPVNATPIQSHIDLGTPYDLFKAKCKEASVTPLSVFHTAWARLLSFYLDATDICFGNVFSCRTIPLEGADRVVGPCFNTLPIRVKFPSTATNEDIMKLNRRNNSDMLLHQLSPLRRIQKRSLSDGSRLFDTLVILQTKSLDLDENLWKLVSEEGNMDFPFICEITPDDKQNNVHICLHSQESHISPADGELIVRQFATLVDQTIHYPSGQASDKRPIEGKMPSLPRKVNGRSRKFETLGHAPSQASRPWSREEEKVRDILCDFTKVGKDGVIHDTTIFQLGLDSINAVQIAARLRDLGYAISAGSILEAATISNIAALLVTNSQVTKEDSFDFSSFETQYLRSTCQQLQISEETVECLRPCTPVQNGMLAMFSNSNGDMYFNRMDLAQSMPLDSLRLKEAWRKVMAKHEMLRTGFVQLQDQKYPFAMITYREGAIDIPWFDAAKPPSDPGMLEKAGVLKNLHQPPWYLVSEGSASTSILQLSALHAIYDAQSLHLVLADVAAAYKGESLGDGVSINPTLGPILTESFLKSDEAESFWKELSKDIQPTKFPDLHPYCSEKKELLANSISCSRPRKSLEDGCQKIGMTLQAAGQAAWARLLSAYTGEPNVVFGVVSSGRNLSTAAQGAVFPCLVTMPSPCRVAGTNRELLDSIMKRSASLVKHQFAPLSKIQRWLRADEGLFDTLFVYQKFSSQREYADAWKIVDEDTRIDYPVSIEMVPHLNELELRMTHRSDVVPAGQAVTLLEQLHVLLEDSIFSPDSSSNDYSPLGPRLLSITPAKEESIPCSATLLHQFVENNAATVPSKAAFEFAWDITEERVQKKTWNYSELNNDGNKIARLLQDKGATPGSLVAICFDKCPEASLGILGVMKAGCAYVAIDPNAPNARKQFILEDSSSRLLLCTQSGRAGMGTLSGVELIALDEPGLFDGLSPEKPILSRPISPNDTCYCLYTSGTTGTPKGCEITHENAVQAMLAFQRLFGGHWDSDSRWLQFASFHFDVSVLEQYWSWSVGICVTSCPRDLLFEDLPGTIQRLQITHIDLTPSLARLVHPDEVPSLCRGVFITGGEQLKQEILDAWGKHGVIYNGYGPTEVTIGCTMLPRVPANGKPSNIGPQFDNVGSYVLVPGTSTPVLRGGIGELCVSGALVGRGYLNRPELTQERFQFLSEHGERIYRTGDLVRILHDGSFQFLGRIDDQVKLRGQRLEIGEINEVIRGATEELGEAATLVAKHPKQSREQLVSFVTRNTAERKPPSAEVRFSRDDQDFLLDIKSTCHSKLPGYMVPTRIIPMTLLPLSANNKVDMKVLKGIYQDLSLEEIQKLAPASAEKRTGSGEEQRIISVLSGFIEPTEDEISPWTSIYELGLDSISVIAFSRRLKNAGFVQSQPSLIMKNPTIAGMASALQSSKGSSTARTDLYENARQNIEAFGHKNLHSIIENLGISDNDVEKIAPCTPLQEGIVYQFLNSGKALYCSSFSFEFHEPCDMPKLEKAWSQTQSETQMLRARLSPTPDGYAQVILKDCRLPVFETSVSSEREIEEAQKSKFEAWTANLGDLSKDLWMVWAISSPTKSVMCLNIFHALYDGSSLPLLLEKVAGKYLEEDRAVEREPPFFDTLPVGPLCKDPAAESFWTEHLKGARHESVPKSNSVGHTSVTRTVDIKGIEHVDKFRKSINVTEQAVLHACWLLTLQHQFGLVPQLGMVISGRALDIPGIENVIGPLFNTIPSNINFKGLKTWPDLVQRCHDYHVSTIPFQHTPLRDIMKWTRRSPNEPLFDSLFVFRRSDNEHPPLVKKLWQTLDSEAEHDYPLAFEVARNDNDSLTATIAVQDCVMSSETAQEMLVSFERHLNELSQDSAQELPQTIAHTDVEEVKVEMPQSTLQTDQSDNFEWTPEAIIVRGVIAELAGIGNQSVGADKTIFEIGLDSIDAIKLSSRLKKLGIQLPVSTIMRHRSIRGMTEQLSLPNNVTQNGGSSSLGHFETQLTEFLKREMQLPEDACRILPATPIQEAMVAEMVASDYLHYYNHDVLELEPHVDIGRLVNAWKSVVNANPILRTSFVEVWDPKIPISYAQLVHREGSMDLQKVDLNGRSVDTIIRDQQAAAASNLAQRPLLTVTLAVDNDRRYLVLSMAHSLYDGWSMDLLHGDIARFYAGEDYQRPPYDDILGHIIASSGESASKFWRATLANFTPAPFPKGQNAGNDEMVVHREERTFAQLPTNAEGFCRANGVTMQALCVTCWSLVLAGYVGRPDMAFGLVLSGRNTADSEDVMFPTMNTVAMRSILHGRRLEMVKYVQNFLVDMGEHQHFPLRRARPDIGSKQLFDTLFIYQKRRSDDTSDLPALYKSTGGSSAIEYPVCVEMESLAETVVCRLACRDNVLGAVDSIGLLKRIEQVLSSILREPDQQTVEFVDGTVGVSGFSTPYEACADNATNGMVDRVESPGQDQTEWTSLELQIRKVLSLVADIPEAEIGKEATLFQLGLDSISAIKVSSLLKKQSVKLAVSDMLRAGTIAKMALAANRNVVELTSDGIRAALERSLKGVDTAMLLQSHHIDLEQVEGILPVTAGQSYFLSMNALNPESFYPTFYYLASENLDPSLLGDAWDQLTEQIPMLRTAFVPTSLKHPPFIQAVMKAATNPVIWHRGSPDQVLSEHPRRAIRLVPVTLFASQTAKGTALMLRMHHALYDGVTLPKIMETLAAVCNDRGSQSQANAQLAPYIAFQSIHSPVDIRRSFWENYLGKHHEAEVPACEGNYTGSIERWYRPGLVANMAKIEATAKRENISTQSIFLAVYARIHAQICRNDQPQSNPVAVGLYLANRSYAMEGLSDLVAPTVNIVPLRIDDKHGKDSLFVYARKIQDELNEISRVEYSGVSLSQISEWTGLKLDTCINFMKIPELAEGSSDQMNGSQLRIAPVTAQDLQELASQSGNCDTKPESNGSAVEANPPMTNGIAVPNGTGHEPGHSGVNGTTDHLGSFREVFKPTLDVEAAIRHDRLDFGVFGLEDRLGGLAENVIEGVRLEMSRLTEVNGDV